MDIILGLPGELEADVQHSDDEIVKLNPDSLTYIRFAVSGHRSSVSGFEEHGIAMLPKYGQHDENRAGIVPKH